MTNSTDSGLQDVVEIAKGWLRYGEKLDDRRRKGTWDRGRADMSFDDVDTLVLAVLEKQKRIEELTGRVEDMEAEDAYEITNLRKALETVDSQAVCVGMDGDEGNYKMLQNIHEIVKAAQAATKEVE